MLTKQQQALRYDLFQAERRLQHVEALTRPDSAAVKAAQHKLLRLWAMLKMTRAKEDFLPEVLL